MNYFNCLMIIGLRENIYWKIKGLSCLTSNFLGFDLDL